MSKTLGWIISAISRSWVVEGQKTPQEKPMKIGEVVEVPSVGCALRKSTVPGGFSVEIKNGPEDEFGEFESGPGSPTSVFKTEAEADAFLLALSFVWGF